MAFGLGKLLSRFKRAPKPLQLIPFSDNPPRRLHDLICDGVMAENLPDFATLLEIHAKLQAEHPDKRILATLDDPGQAVYTSFHATFSHRLDSTEGHDLSGLPPECFEDGEHIGSFTTEAEFPFKLANLKKAAEGMRFEDARGVMYWPSGEYAPTLDGANRDPEEALRINRDQESHFQFVPVTRAADALAALPNGYFYGSLNPMQSYAVAQHLEDEHGFELFGIGASYFGFKRDTPVSGEAAKSLAADIVSLYQNAPSDGVERLAASIDGKDWLLIAYTES